MSLKKIQGKIAKAGAYPLKAPKTVTFNGQEKVFTHRHAIQMESGEWIGFGESHLDNFLVKDDEDNFKVLGAGSEVLIKYSESGDFKNAKKGNLVVLDLVAGEKFEKSTPVQNNQQSNTNSANKGNFVNPAARGQAMNLAAEVLGYKESDFSDAQKIVYAIKWYLNSVKDFEALWDTAEKEIVAGNTPVPEEKPTKKKAPVVEDDYDDMDV